MTTKEERDSILKLWSTPLPNEDAVFKMTREKIYETLKILCRDIDTLESRLREVLPELN